MKVHCTYNFYAADLRSKNQYQYQINRGFFYEQPKFYQSLFSSSLNGRYIQFIGANHFWLEAEKESSCVFVFFYVARIEGQCTKIEKVGSVANSQV